MQQDHAPLKKVLGIFFGIAIVVGSTIGVGILRTPGSIAALVPDPMLIMACWLLIGLYILLAASSYAELTVMMPKAGGAYNYIHRAFGHFAGFLFGWFDLLNNAIAPAFFCIVLGEYTADIFPTLVPYETFLALGYLLFFSAVNLPGVRSGSTLQKVSSILKIVLFLILIVGCFVARPGYATPETTQFAFTGTAIIGIFKALQLIMGTYDGWMAVSFFAEEDSHPERQVPRSYLIGAFGVMMIYLLINGAILYAVPIDVIAQSPLAAAEAADVAFGSWGSTLVTAVSVFSIISILNAYVMIPPRILFGLGRDGFAPKQVTYVNTGGTPHVALMAICVFDAILIVLSSFETLFGLATFMMAVVTLFAFASVIALRIKEPGTPRPYRAWGYPFSSGLLVLVTLALIVGFVFGDPFSAKVVVAISVLCYFIYRFLVKKSSTSI
ncbi:APC family permease [Flavobacterium caeni]|uniref:Basic amino acid/polyamine antiporter, APA family n=1 Tax=Flavobacterium caeni TaxID=490189 RepID=A0A1G5JQK0_9FLAO|nr:APC family permease [Flavobacterium caeni]SCY90597.1 basic amino acid/polyamine antiporter, APA family [Flavobacterium caeni]